MSALVLVVASAFLCRPAAADSERSFADLIRYGSIDQVKAAIAKGADIGQRDFFGNTPLHLAAESQSGEKVKALLAAGADVNGRNNDGETPLHRVIGMDSRWQPAVDALLEAKGLDVNATDKKGRSLLYLASWLKNTSSAKRLLAMGAKDSIHAAALRGDAAAVKAAIKAGTEVNAANATGETALMLAAARGHVELIKDLARRDAKLDCTDPTEGRTALMFAAHAGQVQAIDTLLALGADMNLTTRFGSTFLDYAIIRIRDCNGGEQDKADNLAKLILADVRAKPDLRAAALLRQADAAAEGMSEPIQRPPDPKLAEELYRRAIAQAPRSRGGTGAAVRLSDMLWKQERWAAVAEMLIPLIMEDEFRALQDGQKVLVWSPDPDYRHRACVQVAEAYMKLNRDEDALVYARLARDKYKYTTSCGTELAEYLKSVDGRVKTLERRTLK